MDAISNVKSWIGSLVDNIKGLVKDLGDGGLAGLITVGVILWLFSKRKAS